MNLTTLVQIGGAIQLGILFASALVPGVLDWRSELRPLSVLSRRLIWVHGAFIVLVIIGFGIIALSMAAPLTDGSGLGRSLCAFIGLFWFARLGVQFFVFDARPYLVQPLLKIGYHALTVAFIYLSVVFLLVAWLA
jgi:hypothetical protein